MRPLVWLAAFLSICIPALAGPIRVACVGGRITDGDTVHPDAAGAALLAKAGYKALTEKDFHGEVPAP